MAISHAVHAEEHPLSSPAQDGAMELALVVRRARQARAAGRFAEAQAALEEALSPDNAATMTATAALRAQLFGELGLCELGQHKYRDAAEHLHESLHYWTELPRAYQLEFQTALNRATDQVGRIYYIQTPPDAAVLLDGRPRGRVKGVQVYFVEPGKHAIRARLDGYKDVLQTFEIGKGQTTSITMELPRAPEAPARAAGSAPEKPQTTRPARALQAAAAAPSKGGSALRTTGWALTGVTAAAGGAFLLGAEITRANHDERSAELRRDGWLGNTCAPPGTAPVCTELRDLREQRALLGTLGVATLATSGAIGVATLVSYLFDQKTASREGVSVVPVVTRQTAGLWMKRAW
jgi:tetratricopeptide (TPR) repeat protein